MFERGEGGVANNYIPDLVAPKPRENDAKLIDRFKDLNFDIQKHPELLKRLLYLDRRPINNGEREREKGDKYGSNLEHTLNVESVVTKLSSYFDDELGEPVKDKLRLAALFHDIGKTGSNQVGEDVQTAMTRLFSLFEIKEKGDRRLPQLTIAEALEYHAPKEKAKVLEALQTTDIGPETKMAEIYKSHLEHSVAILKGSGIDPEIVFIAGQHHRLQNNYDYNFDALLDGKEISPDRKKKLDLAAAILEIADFYDATTKRGGSSHQKAVAEIEEKFDHINPYVGQVVEKLKTLENNL